ncbi:hypothetical protein DPEC_G00322560 [Dallia pectoralis]|uniref:Uncharacterized protein n=1 Tax=Dallia pectoralis TaxID=75939 RepID=A0ACC2FAB9_DALPE|nr:hypothetical protein DPEC_G00322560 [Dallia pectoralis]
MEVFQCAWLHTDRLALRRTQHSSIRAIGSSYRLEHGDAQDPNCETHGGGKGYPSPARGGMPLAGYVAAAYPLRAAQHGAPPQRGTRDDSPQLGLSHASGMWKKWRARGLWGAYDAAAWLERAGGRGDGGTYPVHVNMFTSWRAHSFHLWRSN